MRFILKKTQEKILKIKKFDLLKYCTIILKLPIIKQFCIIVFTRFIIRQYRSRYKNDGMYTGTNQFQNEINLIKFGIVPI